MMVLKLNGKHSKGFGMLKVGDLVDVTEERGYGQFKKFKSLGLAIVIEVNETDDLYFEAVGNINLGDDVTVLLNTGELDVFNEQSLELVCST